MFRKWIYETSLDGIDRPTRVKLEATVVSSNMVESPFTGLHAAAFEWSFFVRHGGRRLEKPRYVRAAAIIAGWAGMRPLFETTEIYRPVGSRRLGDELLLEAGGKLIQVQLREAVLSFPHATDGGSVVQGDLPAAFSKLLSHEDLRGPLVYRELALTSGNRVTLLATVAPLPNAVAPYRASSRCSGENGKAAGALRAVLRGSDGRPDFSARAPIMIEDRTGATLSP